VGIYFAAGRTNPDAWAPKSLAALGVKSSSNDGEAGIEIIDSGRPLPSYRQSMTNRPSDLGRFIVSAGALMTRHCAVELIRPLNEPANLADTATADGGP
jgi:hypothetical protein